ncbi:putative mitochondrial protein [Glycine soja]
MQSYPPRALDRRLQENWAKDAREGPRILMSLRSTKFRALLFLSLHSSPSFSKLLSMASYGEAKESIDEEDPRPPSSNGAYIMWYQEHLHLVASPLSLPSPFRCHSSSKKQRNPMMKKILGLQAPMELTSCDPQGMYPPLFSLNLVDVPSTRTNPQEMEKGDTKEFRRLVLHSFGKGRRETQKEFRRVNGEGSTPKDPLYKILDELRSLKLWKEKQERKEKELSDYYRGRHSSHTKHHSQRREKDKRPQEVNISLPYFHGKNNVEAYLDWEVKVEQLFSCHHISEERKVPLATLSFQGYALYWWTSLVRERRIHGDPPVDSYPWPPMVVSFFETHLLLEVVSPLSLPSPFCCHLSYKKQRNPLMKKILGLQAPMELTSELMDKLQRLRQGSMSVEEYRQQMELLLLRATSIARFLSGLNMEVRDKVELFPYRNLDELVQLCIRVEQQLKRKPSSKSYDSHSCPRKDQAHGILGAAPSKPKEDKGHIASQCPTKKTMIMRGQDIYSSQEETTSCPSSSGSEDEVRGEVSSEEVYPHEEGDLLMAKGKEKEEKDSSKKIVKKENHFATKGDIKRALLLKQSFYLLLPRETSLSTAIPLELEVIPQVKELLDEGLVCMSLNPCALLVPKIGIIRHQIPMIGGAHVGHLRFVVIFCRNNQHENKEKGLPMDPKRIKVIPEWPTPPSIREIWGFNILTNFYKRFVPYFSILVAPLIELVRNYILSWEDGQEMGFQSLPYSNIPNITNTYGEGMMQSYPPRALDRRLQEDWAEDARECHRVLTSLRVDFGPMG